MTFPTGSGAIYGTGLAGNAFGFFSEDEISDKNLEVSTTLTMSMGEISGVDNQI